MQVCIVQATHHAVVCHYTTVSPALASSIANVTGQVVSDRKVCEALVCKMMTWQLYVQQLKQHR